MSIAQARGGAAMQPDERLDALLSRRQRDGGAGATDAAGTTAGTGMAATSADEGANGQRPLLDAADRLAVWGDADPSPAFADRLEAHLLARFAARPLGDAPRQFAAAPTPPTERQGPQRGVANGAADPVTGGPVPAGMGARPAAAANAPLPLAGRPDAAPGAAPETAAAADGARAPGRLATRRPSGIRAVRPLWRAVAAALLLVVGGGAIAAAGAGAAPGQPLYGVHRFEQGLRSGLANSPEERVRLHLQYARDALAAFNAAIAHQSGASAYRDALAALADEERTARADLEDVPAGAERDALAAQLAGVRDDGRRDLLLALPPLDWATRAEITIVLGQLGGSAPRIARAAAAGASHDGNYTWTITVEGSGFAPGAVALINGQPMGTVISRSATTLVAQIPGGDLRDGTISVGVGNPDGTAAIVANVAASHQDDHGGRGSPTPQATAGGDDHGGGSGGSGGGGGGGPGGGGGSGGSDDHGGDSAPPTPTPAPTSTPTPTPTPSGHH